MISSDALARMRQQNIKEINKDDLVDIRSVVVDTSLPPEQRMMDYLEKSKIPTAFAVGMQLFLFTLPTRGTVLTAFSKITLWD